MYRAGVLSIAGFDPSGGAGVLADIKVFEQLRLTGMAIATSITCQDENEFIGCDWLSYRQIISQIEALVKRHSFGYVKIGLVQNLGMLQSILQYLETLPVQPKVVWDPVLSTSSGFMIHENIDKKELVSILQRIYVMTPNLDELDILSFTKGAEYLSQYCNVLVKVGHGTENHSNDILYLTSAEEFVIPGKRLENVAKHGSGCVFSSALTSFLVKGFSLPEACEMAKEYTLQFLTSSDTLLGFHRDILMESNVAAG